MDEGGAGMMSNVAEMRVIVSNKSEEERAGYAKPGAAERVSADPASGRDSQLHPHPAPPTPRPPEAASREK